MTETKDRQEIIQKIRKLYTLAGNEAATEGETSNALLMAQKLLIKYNIDQAELYTGQALSEGIVAVKASYTFPRIAQWIHSLGFAVADAFQCQYYLSKTFAKSYRSDTIPAHERRSFYFFGREANAEIAAATFDYLCEQLQALGTVATSAFISNAKEKYGLDPWNTADRKAAESKFVTLHHPVTYRTSWLEGAVSTLRERLRAQKQSFNSDETAIVLVMETEVKEAWDDFSEGFRNLPPRKEKQNHSFAGWAQGRTDGEGINIHKPVEEGSV